MASKTSFFRFQSVKSPAEMGNCRSLRLGLLAPDLHQGIYVRVR